MNSRSAQLQIRVKPEEKVAIQRLASQAGMDMSAYVLSRVLLSPASRFASCAADCATDESTARYALAELNTFLSSLSAPELKDAVAARPDVRLTPYVSNYMAAMVELACQLRGIAPPAWLCLIEPLMKPVFASTLHSLRLHLLMRSPPPFRRRNIFIDSSVGDRV